MSAVIAGPAATAPAVARTRLSPEEPFPAEVTALPLAQLQVLHSRVCLQLEDEYLQAPEGAHPVTLERHQDLVHALAAHQGPGAVANHG